MTPNGNRLICLSNTLSCPPQLSNSSFLLPFMKHHQPNISSITVYRYKYKRHRDTNTGCPNK